MVKFLKKGISTPIAIGIILVLAVLVGGFTLWQYSEMWREEGEFPKIEIPEKEEETAEESSIVKCSNLKFEDYPVTKEYKGEIAEVDFESAPQYYNFYTAITNGAKEGPNFAGKYTIVTWGCGAPCQSNIVVDSQTGKILDGFFSAWGSDYNIDSTLLISDIGAYKGTVIEYYEFKDEKLNLVCKVGDRESEEKTADWKIYRDEEYGFEFEYPNKFFHGEPELNISSSKVVILPEDCLDICSYADSPDYPGMGIKGERVVINNKPYCSYQAFEGAAGSTYIDYYYTTIKDEKCLTVHLIRRESSCGNYGSPGEEAYEECVENKTTQRETLNEIISSFNFLD